MPISDCCTEKELKKWRKEGYSDKEIYAWCREHPGRDAEGDWSPGAPPPPQRKEKDSNKSTTGAPPVDKASLPSLGERDRERRAAGGVRRGDRLHLWQVQGFNHRGRVRQGQVLPLVPHRGGARAPARACSAHRLLPILIARRHQAWPSRCTCSAMHPPAFHKSPCQVRVSARARPRLQRVGSRQPSGQILAVRLLEQVDRRPAKLDLALAREAGAANLLLSARAVGGVVQFGDAFG